MAESSAMLLIEEIDGKLRELQLPDAPLVIGRGKTCDLVLEGRMISREHARIAPLGHCFSIEDLGSRNGTTVNAEPVAEARTLQDGDVIELGGLGRIYFGDNDITSTRMLAPARGVWLDQTTQDVWVDGLCLRPKLSTVQFTLLHFLNEHRDQLCLRADIIGAIWPGTSAGISDDAVDALIKRVRARLGEVPNGQRYLITVRGRGLILHSPEQLDKA